MKNEVILEILLRKCLNIHPQTARSVVRIIKKFKIGKNIQGIKPEFIIDKLIMDIEHIIILLCPPPINNQINYRDLIKVEKRDGINYEVYFNGVKIRNKEDLYLKIILELQTQS